MKHYEVTVKGQSVRVSAGSPRVAINLALPALFGENSKGRWQDRKDLQVRVGETLTVKLRRIG